MTPEHEIIEGIKLAAGAGLFILLATTALVWLVPGVPA